MPRNVSPNTGTRVTARKAPHSDMTSRTCSRGSSLRRHRDIHGPPRDLRWAGSRQRQSKLLARARPAPQRAELVPLVRSRRASSGPHSTRGLRPLQRSEGWSRRPTAGDWRRGRRKSSGQCATGWGAAWPRTVSSCSPPVGPRQAVPMPVSRRPAGCWCPRRQGCNRRPRCRTRARATRGSCAERDEPPWRPP